MFAPVDLKLMYKKEAKEKGRERLARQFLSMASRFPYRDRRIDRGKPMYPVLFR
ncbi:MAG: hypothetical protein LBD78_03335 [Spirochaetaceae bacterium]|nr:hypothetical protein [Spirochaetaceae bacterium]